MMNNRKPLALYLHVPFCVQKCRYCDFFSAPADAREKEQYVRLLCQEIDAWGRLLRQKYMLRTVFVGGGTPTCLTPDALVRLDDAIRRAFDVTQLEEYTIEANPGTVTPAHVQALQHMGVSRVSLGLQSAQETELSLLGRIHTYPQFVKTYQCLRDGGIANINVDLMAAIPGQTAASYRDTLERVISLKPEHISSYSLIVEPGTVFAAWEAAGTLAQPGEEEDRQMYELTGALLETAGYRRYEISNYALPGRACRHNCVYWTGGEYLGLGASASSYLGGVRFSVPGETTRYRTYLTTLRRMTEDSDFSMENFQDEKGCFCAKALPVGSDNEKKEDVCPIFGTLENVEVIDLRKQMEEFMFLGLRMTDGISKREFARRFGNTIAQIYKKPLQTMMAQGLLEEDETHERIRLTRRGIDVSNVVLAEFLL